MNKANINKLKSPLVSVIVITYNSSSTIIETLDSIKDQTYPNIELIISDDCSPDNTVQIAKEWIESNNSRFVNCEIVTTEKNTGVSGNVNRGTRKAHGEWIKGIAGDDLLIPTAIEEFISFVLENSNNIRMCVSDVEPFSATNKNIDNIKWAYEQWFKYEQEPYKKQRERIHRILVFVGPAYFYTRELFEEVGGFSERYGNADEWPFVYKVIMGGNRIYAINKKLVRYRVQDKSLCNSRDSNGLGSYTYFMSTYKFFFDCPFKNLIREGHILVAWDMFLAYKLEKYRYETNNNVKKVNFVRKLFNIINPYAYLRKFKIVEKYGL